MIKIHIFTVYCCCWWGHRSSAWNARARPAVFYNILYYSVLPLHMKIAANVLLAAGRFFFFFFLYDEKNRKTQKKKKKKDLTEKTTETKERRREKETVRAPSSFLYLVINNQNVRLFEKSSFLF